MQSKPTFIINMMGEPEALYTSHFAYVYPTQKNTYCFRKQFMVLSTIEVNDLQEVFIVPIKVTDLISYEPNGARQSYHPHIIGVYSEIEL